MQRKTTVRVCTASMTYGSSGLGATKNSLVEDCLMQDISWNIREEPSEALELGDDDKRAKADLTEKLFDNPIFLELGSRYAERSYRVPVFGGSVHDVLSAVHTFYKLYEKTHSMGDGVWFEGLTCIEPGVWSVLLGS